MCLLIVNPKKHFQLIGQDPQRISIFHPLTLRARPCFTHFTCAFDVCSQPRRETIQILYTIIYVLPFYLHPTTRPSPILYRDSPSVIRTRIRLVSISVALSVFITTYVLAQDLHLSRLSILHCFGVYPAPLLSSIVRPVLLTACLFAGPLFEKGVIEGEWRRWWTLRPVKETLSTWTGYRNFVVGPLSEEILFRALIISLHLFTPPAPDTVDVSKDGSSQPHPPLRILIFITPLYFGIAHIHHCYEQRLTHPRIPFLPILLSSIVQFAYTTVFGWYAAFLYLRTGSLWGVVAVHSFCNCMGLPRIWGRVGGEIVDVAAHAVGGRPTNGSTLRGKEDGEMANGMTYSGVQERQLSVWWTVAYYVVLVGGAVGWYRGLWWLTDSDNALVDFMV